MNNNDIIFSTLFYNDELLDVINKTIDSVRNNSIVSSSENNEDIIHIDIIFDFLDEEDFINQDDTNYYNNCKSINNNLCKPIKIKENDHVLSENCLICMEEYKIKQLKRILPKCNHYFHKKCIDKWLKKKANCPICRDNTYNNVNYNK